MKTLYAIDSTGRPVARLALAEGADRLDAELFVLRGKVRGAVDVVERPSLTETANRIDAAIARLAGLPAPEPIKESEQHAPGSLEETAARIDESLHRLNGRGPASAASSPTSHLPTVTVPKQQPRTDLKPIRETRGESRSLVSSLSSVELREVLSGKITKIGDTLISVEGGTR